MSVISHQTIDDSIQGDGRRYVTYEYIFSQGKVSRRGPKLVEAGFDDASDRASSVPYIELDAEWEEIAEAYLVAEHNQNPDRTSIYQPQNDFDRRLLGRFMFEPNSHVVLAAYPFFQAMELRGGSNANQRADYLGVVRSEYNLVQARFNNVSGVAWFLNDEKNQIWRRYPSEDWL